MDLESVMKLTRTQSQSTEIDPDTDIPWSTANPWGQLDSKHQAVPNYSLIESIFTVGNINNNTCIFNKLPNVSSQHFKLSKDLSDRYNPVYIEDLSDKGTYVNGHKIGTGKNRILKHDDIISIVDPNYNLFQFKNLQISITTLPHEITVKYHIGRHLGSGASGTVFLVYDYQTCEAFALKQMKEQCDRVKNECKIMQSLKHPCAVKMYDVYNIQDSFYILLEFMKGGDLLQRILQSTNSCLSEDISKLFFYQMCHAVAYLHSRNIAHRDLKPDNMLLASSDTETLLKISDFGLSKSLQNNSVLRTMCGTPHYVAPEVLQTKGQGQYTIAVDIWSLGVVLFTCLSGTLPFSKDYGTPATEQIMKGDFRFRSPKWSHVSATAQKLVKQLLTVDANQRPSIDHVLKHEWFDDFNMKCKAYQIMNNVPPQPQQHNDENAPPIKKRHTN